MAARILGISGSPIPTSNTDRAVQAILEWTGLESEFIKLSELDIAPCRACLGCKETNECVQQDDGRELAEKFHHADAFVLGGYTPYSSLDARSKTFIERMYCLRHREGLNRGKVGASVITTACPPNVEGLPPAAQTATSQVAFWMMEEGMVNVGSMLLLGNVPCIKCGHGDDCPMSGIKMLYGQQASVASVGVHTFEGDSSQQQAAKHLAGEIRQAVRQRRQAQPPR